MGVAVCRRSVFAAVIAVASSLVVGSAVAWGAPLPESPGDRIAALVTSIADVDQQIADLERAAAGKREGVNRTLVDLQMARDAQQLAAVAAGGARRSLSESTAAANAAQQQFDAVVARLYRQGNSSDSTGFLLSPDPDSFLERTGVIGRITREQRRIVDDVKRRRNDAANRSAIAETTVTTARRATTTAQRQQQVARSALTDAMAAVTQQQTRRAALTTQRREAAAQLARLRPAVATGRTPVAADSTPVAAGSAPLPSAAPPSATPGAVPDPAAMVREAVVKLAKNAVQQALAAIVASLSRPHTDIERSQQPSPPAAASPPPTQGEGGSPPSTPSAVGPIPPDATAGPAAVETVVNRAMSQLGVPYSWGGGNASGPTVGVRDGGVADSFGDYAKVGFDCSGLILYAFAGAGIALPHYTGYQYTSGRQIPLADIQRGDIIFYGPNASEHNALYIGDNKMIEAPQSGDVVKVSALRTSGAMPYVVRLL